MKKWSLALVLSLLIMSWSTIVLAASSLSPTEANARLKEVRISMEVGRDYVSSASYTFYKNGHGVILIPLKPIVKLLGYTMQWKEKEQVITIKQGSKLASLTIGENRYYTFDRQIVYLDAVPVIIDHTTYIPLSFLTKVLKARVANVKEIPAHKLAYLTFDDGPTAHTGQILDILKQYNSKSTFFMLEPNMRNYPEVVQRMAAEGHELALHGVTHQVNKFYRSQQSVVNEMNQGQATIQKITGIYPELIRTPYGSKPHMTPAYKQAVAAAGYKMWDWNVDSKDWYYRSEQMVAHTIQQLKNLESKKVPPVILFHDLSSTAQYLPEILDYLQQNGYVIQKLDSSLIPLQF